MGEWAREVGGAAQTPPETRNTTQVQSISDIVKHTQLFSRIKVHPQATLYPEIVDPKYAIRSLLFQCPVKKMNV